MHVPEWAMAHGGGNGDHEASSHVGERGDNNNDHEGESESHADGMSLHNNG